LIPLVFTKIVLDENWNYHCPLLMQVFSKIEIQQPQLALQKKT
jgi:hypothetical protein